MMLEKPAAVPKKELRIPVVLFSPVRKPKKELPEAMLLRPADEPKKEFEVPLTLERPAFAPTKVLTPTVELVFKPAPLPTKTLSPKGSLTPATLITGWPARLY